MVLFIEGEEEALRMAQENASKPEAWFNLNQVDDTAQTYKYVQRPFCYV